jgi:hypothetical protein
VSNGLNNIENLLAGVGWSDVQWIISGRIEKLSVVKSLEMGKNIFGSADRNGWRTLSEPPGELI